MNNTDKDTEQNARQTLRLALKFPLTILGKDRQGKEYALTVETINVSARGFAIELPKECVASGDEVFISVATKFNARARVRWLDEENGETGTVRCGVELQEPYSNWVLTE